MPPQLGGGDPRFAVIALWIPDSEDWYGCARGRTSSALPLPFYTLHYNCFSSLLTKWLTLLLRLPALG